MLVRFILLSLLLTLLLRAVLRLWTGFVQGVQGQQGSRRRATGHRTPAASVHMARDPVCGTFVVPERAVVLTTATDRLYFCSAECRDTFRTRAHAHPTPVHGRTA